MGVRLDPLPAFLLGFLLVLAGAPLLWDNEVLSHFDLAISATAWQWMGRVRCGLGVVVGTWLMVAAWRATWR